MTVEYPFGTIIRVQETRTTVRLPSISGAAILVLRPGTHDPGVMCEGLMLEDSDGFKRGESVYVFDADVVEVVELPTAHARAVHFPTHLLPVRTTSNE